MGRATLNSPLRASSREKTIDQARGERIACTNPIEDFEVFAGRGLKKISIGVTDCAPIVPGGGCGPAQRGGDYLKRKILNNFANHLFETIGVQGGKMFVHSGYFVA